MNACPRGVRRLKSGNVRSVRTGQRAYQRRYSASAMRPSGRLSSHGCCASARDCSRIRRQNSGAIIVQEQQKMETAAVNGSCSRSRCQTGSKPLPHGRPKTRNAVADASTGSNSMRSRV
jgi:hypothetical protein